LKSGDYLHHGANATKKRVHSGRCPGDGLGDEDDDELVFASKSGGKRTKNEKEIENLM